MALLSTSEQGHIDLGSNLRPRKRMLEMNRILPVFSPLLSTALMGAEPTSFVNSLGMEMKRVNPGTFERTYGDPHYPGGELDEKAHRVALSEAFYNVGNPVGKGRLVLSLSHDGVQWDRHFVLDERPYATRANRQRGVLPTRGSYGYPHTVIHDGNPYVIVSRQKEAIEVLRVNLVELDQ